MFGSSSFGVFVSVRVFLVSCVVVVGVGLSGAELLAQSSEPGPGLSRHALGTSPLGISADGLRTVRGAEGPESDSGVCVATAAAQLNRILPHYEGMIRRPGDASSLDKSTTTYSADVITFTASPTGGCSAHVVEDVDEYDADLVSISFSPLCGSSVTQETGSEDDYLTLDPTATSGCTAHVVEDVDEYDADLAQVTFDGGGCDGTLTESSSSIYVLDGTAGFDAEVLAIRFARTCSATMAPIAGFGPRLALTFDGGCSASLADDIDAAQVDVVTLTVLSAGFLRLQADGAELDAVLFDAGDWLDGAPFSEDAAVSAGRLSRDGSLFLPVVPGAYTLHLRGAAGFAGAYELQADLFDAPAPDGGLCGDR